MILKFYGASDDIFIVEGPGKFLLESDCYDESAVVEVSCGEDKMHVVGEYAPAGVTGCWMVGVMPWDEGVEIPDWPMKFSLGGRGYSAVLEIVVPEEAVVREIR